jgi:hypothetical protein
VGLILNPCSGLIRFRRYARFIVGLSGGSHLLEKNDYMDDTSKDLLLSPESLKCHPPRMDSR